MAPRIPSSPRSLLDVATTATPERATHRAEHQLHGVLDARAFGSSADSVWLAGGLDKLRFAKDNEPVRLGAALLEYHGTWSPTIGARVTLAAYEALDPIDTPIDVTEAYLEYHPVPRSAWRWRTRAGAFYPPVSLENTETAWTSPYTTSFSAVNTWIAEEIRTLGAELELMRMGRFSGSPHDFGFTAALFRGNDPAGALLSWRGWALHDRQTGLFERLPLAALPGFAENGNLVPQEAFEEPFVELDGRTGFYAGLQWDYLERSRLRVLHYDNLGDPSVAARGQWAWRTRFDHAGWQLRLARQTDLLFQVLAGDTEMDGFEGPLVYVKFWAGYALASRAWGAHRFSLRFDDFAVTDHDSTPDDPNAENGHAWTAAYFYTGGVRAPHAGSWRVGVELLSIQSDRPARRLLGERPERREASAQLVGQLRF